jgi:hypothetical protein
MTDRRYYEDPATAELLFLTAIEGGWGVDVRTMDSWRTGRLRIYKPIDSAFVHTVSATKTTTRWQPLAPEEEPDVRVLMPKPWIPDGQAMEDLCEEDIPTIETALATQASHEYLNDVLRPALVMEFSYTPVTIAAPAAPAPAAPAARSLKTAFPQHLIGPVLAHAAATKALCPITMEPIQVGTATVTGCGHIFQTAALDQWLRSRRQCPECRAAL